MLIKVPMKHNTAYTKNILSPIKICIYLSKFFVNLYEVGNLNW